MTTDDDICRHTHRHNALLGSVDVNYFLSKIRYPESFRPRQLSLALAVCMLHVALIVHWAFQACSAGLPSQGNKRWMSLWTIVPLSVTVFYVAVTRMGMRYALSDAGFSAASVREWMFVYNIHQAVFHSLIGAALIHHAWTNNMSVWGNVWPTVSPKAPCSDEWLAFLLWLHYYTKFVEMIDTFFVVVRHKTSQLTFLHVYQRIIMIWSWHIAVRLASGGDTYFGACVHSCVQALTYGYYLICLTGVSHYARRLVTRTHLFSFGIILVHSAYVAWLGCVPRVLAAIQAAVMINMLVLFTNFHYDDIPFPQPRAKSSAKAPPVPSGPRLVFSFDSSGWGYLYHFGVAKYLVRHVLPRFDRSQVAFSGASGGSLVAAALTLGIDIDELVKYVVGCQPLCRYAPWRAIACADEAIRIFVPQNAHETCSHRLRVLLTRVTPKFPFVMAEVATNFPSYADLTSALRGSCHIPLIAGLRPFQGRYLDGLFWSSLLVPWRQSNESDCVVKSSAIGLLTAQIKPSVPIPTWWMLFPPSAPVLTGLMEQGYADAARFFSCWQSPIPETKSVPAVAARDVDFQSLEVFQKAASLAWMRLVAAIAGGTFLIACGMAVS
eukprot:c9300_g1_i1.p1 GENE.c9300_g1_i1~~c9300_g1_i1.p1  ORF type:complete len:607 (+),score=87.90 c9300_g1_i1:22-1842(+)